MAAPKTGLRRVVGNAVKATVFGGAVAVGTFFIYVRGTKEVPLSTSNKIFKSAEFQHYNPNNNPTTHDLVVKRIPIDYLKEEFRRDQGKLTEKFCAGVWGGLGYRIQRRYMERKYRGPETASQLWDVPDLQSSSYNVGTQITDHFEVLTKSKDSIVVRCGGSPRIKEVRPGEGLFEMVTRVNEHERYVEFALKSVFFQGAGKNETGNPPMPPHIKYLHLLYTKFLLETAVKNLVEPDRTFT